jgi:hypothetical protein
MAPKGNPDAFITLVQVEAAVIREVQPIGSLEMGVDVARFGDDLTVSTLMKGNKVYPQKTLERSDTDQAEDLVLTQLRKYRYETGDKSLCRIKVDASGGYGAGLIDSLNKNTTDNIEVIPVYAVGKIDNPEYYDGVSLMWGELRDQIEYLDLPNDDFLKEEICTRPFTLQNGKVKIWPKEKFKAEYGSSPDRADSLNLALSKKAGIKRVFPYYRSTDGEHRRNVSIPFKDLIPGEYQIYATLFLDKDQNLYGNTFFWGRKTAKLYVYGELFESSPVARIVARKLEDISGVSLDGKQKNHVEKVFGNSEMFRGGNDFQFLLRKAFPPVRVYESTKYEENGAIMLANKMFMSNQVIVDDKLAESDYQYRYWRKENGHPISGFQFCKSLLLVVSELRERGELSISQERIEKPYTKRKRDKQEFVKKNKAVQKRRDRSEYDYLA